MTRDTIRDIGPAKTLLLAGALTLTVLIPLVAGGIKSVPVAQLVQAALAPVTQATAVPEPARRAAIPAQAVAAQRHRKTAAVLSPPRVALLPPDFAPSPVMAVTLVPSVPAASAPADICRAPQQLAGSRLMGPAVCLPQSEWDGIKARGLVLMPDGRTVTARFDGALPRQPCAGSGASAAATGIGIASCF